MTIVEHVAPLERALTTKGFPAMSLWWRSTFTAFYQGGKRQLVLRVGRRGGKSTSLCRIAVLEALYGDHVIPPGDVGVVAIVSVNRTEASERLRTIRAILDVLGVTYHPIDAGIELDTKPIAFRVYTASISGVSGPTCICAICDEVAKWRDADTGANPATEVLASLRPTMATQPNARMFLSSSPLGRLDAHAATFDHGDDEFQQTAFAPTWIANPSVSEADTHALEPDEDRWRREYAAIPFEGDECSLLSAALIDRATRGTAGDLPREPGVTYFAAQDPGFTRNAWSFCVTAQRCVDGRVKRSVVAVREWRGTRERPLRPDDVLRDISVICRRGYGIDHVWTDQYHGQSLSVIAERPDIRLALTVNTSDRSGENGTLRVTAHVAE